MLTLFGMIGRIEKHFIKERQRRGIEAAKAKGVYKGRPPSIDPEKVRELAAQGLGGTEIARRLGIGRASVYRMLGAPAENMAEVIPSPIDQNLWAQSLSPMDMISQGRSVSLFHASQQ
jgi:DNA invertase Pin-like site-specific DNA recombinase